MAEPYVDYEYDNSSYGYYEPVECYDHMHGQYGRYYEDGHGAEFQEQTSYSVDWTEDVSLDSQYQYHGVEDFDSCGMEIQEEEMYTDDQGYDVYSNKQDEETAEHDSRTEQERLIFKLAFRMSVPTVYRGPLFTKRYREFWVRVSPVTYSDIKTSEFEAIKSKAVSFCLRLNGKQSSLELYSSIQTMQEMMEGLMALEFESSVVTIEVERRLLQDTELEEKALPTFPLLNNEVSFKMDTTYRLQLLSEMSAKDENFTEKQRTIILGNLPDNVDSLFLRFLFPLCQKSQLVMIDKFKAGSVVMYSRKMVQLHLACISNICINGHTIEMETADNVFCDDFQVLEEKTQRMLRGPTEILQKPKKKSLSDLRRNVERKQKYLERQKTSVVLPTPPMFPGIPSLLSLPTNELRQAIGAPAQTQLVQPPTQAFQDTSYWQSRSQNARQNDGMKKQAWAPFQDSIYGQCQSQNACQNDGEKKKIRAERADRRRMVARAAVHQAHLHEGNITATCKTMNLFRSLVLNGKMPQTPIKDPKLKLSADQLTTVQLEELRTKCKELIVMKVKPEQMQTAENNWQRRWRQRIESGKITDINHMPGSIPIPENVKLPKQDIQTRLKQNVTASGQHSKSSTKQNVQPTQHRQQNPKQDRYHWQSQRKSFVQPPNDVPLQQVEHQPKAQNIQQPKAQNIQQPKAQNVQQPKAQSIQQTVQPFKTIPGCKENAVHTKGTLQVENKDHRKWQSASFKAGNNVPLQQPRTQEQNQSQAEVHAAGAGAQHNPSHSDVAEDPKSQGKISIESEEMSFQADPGQGWWAHPQSITTGHEPPQQDHKLAAPEGSSHGQSHRHSLHPYLNEQPDNQRYHERQVQDARHWEHSRFSHDSFSRYGSEYYGQDTELYADPWPESYGQMSHRPWPESSNPSNEHHRVYDYGHGRMSHGY